MSPMLLLAAEPGRSFWDGLWPVLLGAILALLGTVGVQLRVTPLVESRKRRMDRWEADVVALIECLVMEYQPARDKLLAAMDNYLMVDREHPINADGKRGPGPDGRELPKDWSIESLRWRRREAAPISAQLPRVDWLIEKVGSLNPDDRDIAAFQRAAGRWRNSRDHLLRMSREFGVRSRDGRSSDPSRDYNRYEKVNSRERSAFNAVVRRLSAFAASPTPVPTGSIWFSRRRKYDEREWVEKTQGLISHRAVPKGYHDHE